MNRSYRSLGDLPSTLPVFPLSGCLLLPRCELPLNIFEPRYVAMIDAALAGDRLIGMIQPDPDIAPQENVSLCRIGCAGRLTRFAETGDGRYLISLEGVCRFRIGAERTTDTLFRIFDVDYDEFQADLVASNGDTRAEREAVLQALRGYAERNGVSVDWDEIRQASDETLINALSAMSPFGAREKQALLEAPDLKRRAAILVALAEIDMSAADRRRGPLH